jgi:hypothetical protein
MTHEPIFPPDLPGFPGQLYELYAAIVAV